VRKSLRLPVILVVVGLLVAVPAMAMLVLRSVRAVDAPSMAAPGAVRRHLSAGTWVVFEHTGTRTGAIGFTVTSIGSPELQPGNVTVTAPDGTEVPVGFVETNQTITRGSSIYTGVLQFSVLTSGTYAVDLEGPQVQVIVTRSLNEALRGIVVLGAVVGIAGLVVLVGLVLLIVFAVRNNRIPRYATLAPAITPPGWYSDPAGQARLRWWDGNRWTDHSA
jgi:hypothetical protein